MRSLFLKTAAAALLVAAAPVSASAEFLLTTEEYPPFNMTFQGRITGLSTDLVRAMFDKAGIAYKIEMLPWNRAIHLAQTQKDTCSTAPPKRKSARISSPGSAPWWKTTGCCSARPARRL